MDENNYEDNRHCNQLITAGWLVSQNLNIYNAFWGCYCLYVTLFESGKVHQD